MTPGGAGPGFAGAQALEGSLARVALPDVLHEVARGRRTGILTIQGEHDIIAVSFLKGEVVAADALNKTVEDGLQEVLVGEGLIRAEQFVAFAAEHQAGGGRVTDLLVERGFLARSQLLAAMREQTYRMVREVLAWQEGDFKFYAGDEVFSEDGLQPIPVAEAVVRASMDLGDGLPGPALDLDAVYETSEPARRPAAEPAATEQALLDRLDGRRSLRQVLAASGLAEVTFLYWALRLQRAQRIRRRLVDGAAAVPAAIPAAAAPPRESAAAAAPAWERSWALAWGLRLGVVALGVALAVDFARRPATLLFPFPWQGAEVAQNLARQREALLLKVDRAVRAYHLVGGRLPAGLGELIDAGLLAPADALDPTGSPLALASGGASYSLQILVPGAPLVLGQAEGVAGDFLLDPEFLSEGDEAGPPPLVLLD